nr:transmembrane protein 207 isoform X2 [Oryctolagus cuniculus]
MPWSSMGSTNMQQQAERPPATPSARDWRRHQLLKVRCVNYNEQQPNSWYVWFLLLIFLVALLCGVVLYCFQCWLKRLRIDSSRRTMAVFAVGDLDPTYGTEASVNPTVGIHLHTQSPELYRVPCFGALGPPPPYEETLKTSQF